MQVVAQVNSPSPPATYVPPAQRFSQGPRSGPPLVPPFRVGINDTDVYPFVAGLVLGSILR